MNRRSLAVAIVVMTAVLLPPYLRGEPIAPKHVRCEYRVDPIGVDNPRPSLSWVLEARPGDRGKLQKGFRILVASSAQMLKSDTGDEWDSGRVQSSESLHIRYGGKPLTSKKQYFWKVRVWDEAGNSSGWSAPAAWTTGMLDKSEWAAKWITDPDIIVLPSVEADSIRGVNSGYRSEIVRVPDTPKWVAVDLGKSYSVEGIGLFSASPYDWQEGASAIYFPLRFRIELANTPDFSDSLVAADRTSQDQPMPDPGVPVTINFEPRNARYVRLFVTRMRAENELFANFALAEMEVLSQGENVAARTTVLALDSLEAPGWSKGNLVDGVTLAIRKKEILQPVTRMRKDFALATPVRRALLFITSRGLYDLHMNGQRVGDHILAPEWTSYRKRSQYQGYDVTREVHQGKNTIGVVLAHGWYSGRVGLMPVRRIYGNTPELLLHLDVEHEDGSRTVIVSDETWRRSHDGPILSADVYDGETHDARKEAEGWDLPGFDDSKWKPAIITGQIGAEELTWQRNDPIRIQHRLKPIAVTEPRPGIYIFDLGQNMVGRVRLQASGMAGTSLRLRHGEALTESGALYTDNLRDARPIDTFVLRGGKDEVFEPRFTYHGFRYAELTGLPHAPSPDTITGIAFNSAASEVGEFATSSPLLDQLGSIILWTQRGNMMGIPTDCPQRPERLGWTGDIQAYAQSSIFNMDMAAFLLKFLQDMRDDQDTDGRFPDVAPDPFDAAPEVVPAFRDHRLHGSPAWSDAGVTLAWDLWANYADKDAVAQQYPAAKAWVEYVRRNNPGFLWVNQRGLDPGDWLNGDTLIWPGWPRTGAAIPLPLHATAFYAHSTDLLSRMAAVLGLHDDARLYRELFAQIKVAFNKAYVSPDGRMEGDTQGGYALALNFNLLPDSLRAAALERLLQGLERYNGHLSTGIQSTHRLLLELTRAGRNDEAYRLVMMSGFPSWSLMIENGATTIWERWDGYVKGRGFQDPSMNSFNHYAFGSVLEWIWRTVLGINPDPDYPGYQHVIIHPRPAGGLKWARGTYRSIRGPITSDWRLNGQRFMLKISVPANTRATVYVPGQDARQVREGAQSAVQSRGVRFVGRLAGALAFEVQSGDYEFVVDPAAAGINERSRPALPASNSRKP
jgi:alpha-L-rhamnosidase